MGRSDYKKDRKGSTRPEGNFRKNNKPKRNAASQKKTHSKQPSDPDLIRLNRYIANSGVCSRRDADIYIAAGNVTVNGKPVTEMGYKVRLTDIVKFDGRLLNPEEKSYVLLNKPKEFEIVTNDAKGRRTANQLILNASKAKLSPVGKMDKNSTGLIVFTNDGDFAKSLTHSKNGLRKIYHVELNRALRQADLKKIQDTLTLEDGPVKVHDISYIENAPKKEVGIEIKSNRNRVVRRIFEHLEYEVVKLDRVVYGGLTKKDLPRGHWRHLTKQELINFGMTK
ncbi:MAG: pseudouridine synthase [Bacteroidota bacterium]